MSTNDWSGQHKQVSREYAFAGINHISHAVLMPGAEQRCLRLAVEMGLLDSNSLITAVERDAKYANIIQEYVDFEFPGDALVHRGSLHTVKLDKPVDYAFIDLLGCISEPVARWIAEELAPNLRRDATLVFTLRANTRGTPLPKLVKAVAPKDYADRWGDLRDRLNSANSQILSQMFILCSTLSRYGFQVCPVFRYRDKRTPMIVVRFNKVRRLRNRTNGYPSLDAILPPTKGTTTMRDTAQKRKEREAGRKSWVTRRANELAEKRRMAGVKSWETRRRNGNA